MSTACVYMSTCVGHVCRCVQGYHTNTHTHTHTHTHTPHTQSVADLMAALESASRSVSDFHRKNKKWVRGGGKREGREGVEGAGSFGSNNNMLLDELTFIADAGVRGGGEGGREGWREGRRGGGALGAWGGAWEAGVRGAILDEDTLIVEAGVPGSAGSSDPPVTVFPPPDSAAAQVAAGEGADRDMGVTGPAHVMIPLAPHAAATTAENSQKSSI